MVPGTSGLDRCPCRTTARPCGPVARQTQGKSVRSRVLLARKMPAGICHSMWRDRCPLSIDITWRLAPCLKESLAYRSGRSTAFRPKQTLRSHSISFRSTSRVTKSKCCAASTLRWKPRLILLEDHVGNLSKHRYLLGAGYRIIRRYENNGWYVPRESAAKCGWTDRWEVVRKYYLALPFRMLRNFSRRLRKPITS